MRRWIQRPAPREEFRYAPRRAAGTADSATAELALGLLICAARGLAVGDEMIRAGGFQMGVPVGIGLAGKTLGLIGLGRLGGYMASYGKALRMNVIAWSQNLKPERAAEVGATAVSKDELMSTADAISIHMVLSDRSRGLVGRQRHRADEAWRDPDQHLPRADYR